MDISKVKYFVYHDVLEDTMIYAKDLETIQTVEDYDIGLYGIVETAEGYILFEIDWTYSSGEPFVSKRFMHLSSFLGFYKHRKAKYLDKHSEKFITNYK